MWKLAALSLLSVKVICNESEPVVTCPKEYVFDGKECTKIIFLPPDQTCPKGYTEGKEGCEITQNVKSEPVCPKGFQPGKDGCQRLDQIPPDIDCPKGYQIGDGECQRARSVAPSKYTVASTTVCKMDQGCPGDGQFNGKECISNIIVPSDSKSSVVTAPCDAVEACPKGYNDNGKTCERTETRGKMGREVVSTVDCDIDYTCPKGSELQGSECVLVKTTEKIVHDITFAAPCPPENFCPAGTIDNGKGCDTEVVVDSIPVHGSKKDDNQDDGGIPPERYCPKGAVDTPDGECLQISTVPKSQHIEVEMSHCEPINVCPKGFHDEVDEKKNQICVSEDKRPTTLTPIMTEATCEIEESCPNGAIEAHGDCVIISSMPFTETPHEEMIECPTYTNCPSGSEDVGSGNCIKTIQVPADQKCAPNEDGGKKDEPDAQESLQCSESCPEGYASIGKGMCSTQEVVPPLQYCKDGCSLNSSKSCTTLNVTVERSCPKGYVESGKECIKEDIVPRVGGCPKGCTSSGKKDGIPQCTRMETGFDERCPKGFDLVVDSKSEGKSVSSCVRRNIIEKVLSCPKDCSRASIKQKKKHHHGPSQLACIRTITHVARDCPKGFRDEKDSCITEQTVSPIYTCPKGTVQSPKGMCVPQHSKHTQVAPSPRECPKGTTPAKKNQCIKIISLPYEQTCPKGCQRKKTKKHDLEIRCLRIERNLSEHCPKGYEDNGKACSSATTVPAEAVCPKDCTFTPESKKSKSFSRCTRVETTMDYTCPKGFDDNGKDCSIMDFVPKNADCPKGCEKTKSGECFTTIVENNPSCPKGATEIPGKDGEIQCSLQRTLPPIPICPKGCTRNSANKHGESQCYRVDQKENSSCPKGYEQVTPDECISYEGAPPNYSCPKGYNLSGEKSGASCVRVEKADFDISCPKGSELQKGNCIRKEVVERESICPKGTTLSEKGCEKIMIAEPQYECPKGSTMRGSKCTDNSAKF